MGSSRYGDGRWVDQVIERQLRRLFIFIRIAYPGSRPVR